MMQARNAPEMKSFASIAGNDRGGDLTRGVASAGCLQHVAAAKEMPSETLALQHGEEQRVLDPIFNRQLAGCCFEWKNSSV